MYSSSEATLWILKTKHELGPLVHNQPFNRRCWWCWWWWHLSMSHPEIDAPPSTPLQLTPSASHSVRLTSEAMFHFQSSTTCLSIRLINLYSPVHTYHVSPIEGAIDLSYWLIASQRNISKLINSINNCLWNCTQIIKKFPSDVKFDILFMIVSTSQREKICYFELSYSGKTATFYFWNQKENCYFFFFINALSTWRILVCFDSERKQIHMFTSFIKYN